MKTATLFRRLILPVMLLCMIILPAIAQDGARAPFTSCADVVAIPVEQCDALVAVYNSTNGASWIQNANWLTDDNPCIWFGVACVGPEVESLILPANNLVGSLPPEIGNLADLIQLNLSDNHLEGQLPPEIDGLGSVASLHLEGNALGGDIPVEFLGLTSLSPSDTDIGYNLFFATNSTVSNYLDSVDPDWSSTQTIPPSNRVAQILPAGLRVSWTPIQYVGDGGYYIVTCGTFTINTINKAQLDVLFTGLPAGSYTCTIATLTPEHANNPNVLTTPPVSVSETVGVPSVPHPPNDLPSNPIVFTGLLEQNYVFNIDKATRDGDPQPPIGNPACPVTLSSTAVAIHYAVPGDVVTRALRDGGGIVTAGGPGWFRNRDSAFAADTAIVVYEVDSANNVITVVGCDDDDAPGEISVSSVEVNFESGKNYRVAIWNEGAAPDGIVTTISPSTFDLKTPKDDSEFNAASAPTTFTWEAYAGSSSYTFNITRTSDEPVSRLKLVELTPDNGDGDGLACNATNCVFTVQPGTDLASFMTNGTYLWSAAGKMASDSMIFASNQIFRFVVTDTPTSELLVNGNFEFDVNDDKVPDGWNGKNLAGDKQKCNKPDKQLAYEGECAFKFKGSIGENSSIDQTIDGAGLGIDQSLTLSAYVTGKGISSGTKLVMKIKYATAPAGKQKLVLPSETLNTYTLIAGEPIALVDTVSSIKVKVKNKNLSGKMVIDTMNLTLTTNSSTTGALIPVPPAPNANSSGLNSRSQQ